MDFYCYTCKKKVPFEICPKCESVTEWLVSYEDLEEGCWHDNLFEYAGINFCMDCGHTVGEDILVNGGSLKTMVK